RTFGKIIICRQCNIDRYLPTLGLEPFSDDFTTQNLKEKMQGKKAPIKTVLLDQSIIAGLGNIYVCEILYRARINPLLPAGKLKQKDIVEIIQQTKQVLSEAILQGGTSISDYRKIDDKTGSFQNFLRVYKKKCCPLSHAIKRIKQSGRSTYYCPICQKNKS
ncbi:MAG: zinc finger domain-containing protein, partial [Candidatus Cloacimonas sp.]